jgi:hypothetical protein
MTHLTIAFGEQSSDFWIPELLILFIKRRGSLTKHEECALADLEGAYARPRDHIWLCECRTSKCILQQIVDGRFRGVHQSSLLAGFLKGRSDAI